jgi:hypothetical protein
MTWNLHQENVHFRLMQIRDTGGVGDYASCVGVITSGGSAQKTSASGGHFLFFTSFQKRAS